MAGTDLRYPTPGAEPHPLLGRFVPALDLGPAQAEVDDLTRAARPILLDLADDEHLRQAAAGWADRVDVVTARCPAAATPALLVRPDGFVAWAGGASPQAALRTWFGPPVPVRV